jgi:hypothetical protein
MRSIKNNFNNISSDASQQQFSDRQRTDPEAVFLGWMETPSGTVALYNVTKPDHPLFQSTVAEDTLQKNNLQIPQIPNDHRKR